MSKTIQTIKTINLLLLTKEGGKMEEIVVDTREFEAPAPMQLVLSALQNIQQGKSYIHQIHRMVPDLLINKIKSIGYEYLIKEDGEDYHIYIFFKNDKEKVTELVK